MDSHDRAHSMVSDDKTDRFRPVFEPEDIFDRFVENANAGGAPKTREDETTGRTALEKRAAAAFDRDVTVRVASSGEVRAAPEDAPEIDEDMVTSARAKPFVPPAIEKQQVMLLTKVKRPSSIPPTRLDDLDLEEAEGWSAAVSPRAQRLEAERLVPDVQASLAKKDPTYVGEGVEDGQMPTRQLDTILADMTVLLRYGHAAQVRDRLDVLRRTYPEDLLLLRRIAEFHLEHEQSEAAMDTLFALAGGLFERRNLEGMRQTLEQVLVLEPQNARASRLLGLLEAKNSS